ncbi:histone H3/CENP-A [Trema orientale]|uniref:Histone H3/CENP-A n=1 Tax=Trema orientale TaxID=63057 RepID=A0A2P5C7U6_TREOI|nr:histone H3/CENP-A [Trema orientale]
MATIPCLLPTIMGPLSAAAGTICLFRGSFSENQFGDGATPKIVVFTVLGLILCVFFYNARNWNNALENVCRKHRFVKALIEYGLLVCASTVNFLIKYPRFNVHSAYTKCCFEEQGNRVSRRTQFNLYTIGSFSFLALVISSKRQKAMELGVFDFLLGLTMDASMEIPGKDGPNLWYMRGAFMYCALLVAMRSYQESLMVRQISINGRQVDVQDLQMVVVVGERQEATEESGTVGGDVPTTDIFAETTGLLSESASYIDEERERENTAASRERFVEEEDQVHEINIEGAILDPMISSECIFSKMHNLRFLRIITNSSGSEFPSLNERGLPSLNERGLPIPQQEQGHESREASWDHGLRRRRRNTLRRPEFQVRNMLPQLQEIHICRGWIGRAFGGHAIHAKRVAIMPKDIQLARRIMGERAPVFGAFCIEAVVKVDLRTVTGDKLFVKGEGTMCKLVFEGPSSSVDVGRGTERVCTIITEAFCYVPTAQAFFRNYH